MKFIYTLYKCLIFIYTRVNVNVQNKTCKCKIIENIWFLLRGDFIMFLVIGQPNGPFKKSIKAFVLWDAPQPIKLINMDFLVIKGI